MTSAEAFRDLISGKKSGLSASILRGALRLLETPYSAVMSLRNFCYDKGVFKTTALPIPIISVGNITLGGTGKTPFVAWLVRFYLDHGRFPGIISRGFGTAKTGTDGSKDCNDEYLELLRRFPNQPHKQNPNRVAAAREFLHENLTSQNSTQAVDVLILDDAMQHRRIARNLNVVLLDALEPFGFEHVFPRGALREPLSGLRRADIVLLSRADLVSAEKRNEIWNRVAKHAPKIVWGELQHVPQTLVTLKGTESDMASLKGKRVLAFCGIGNPDGFAATLRNSGAEVVKLTVFPDHYRYKNDDINRLINEANGVCADRLVCTMKDWVKIDPRGTDASRIAAVSIKIQFLSGEKECCEKLRTTLDETA